MHLIIERQGGFAGLSARAELTEGEMSSGQKQCLERLLASPPAAASMPGADRFIYHLTIEQNGITRELVVPETELPDELKALPKVKL